MIKEPYGWKSGVKLQCVGDSHMYPSINSVHCFCKNGPERTPAPTVTDKCAGKEEPLEDLKEKCMDGIIKDCVASIGHESVDLDWRQAAENLYFKIPEGGENVMSVVDKVKQLAKSKDQRLLEKYDIVECDQLTHAGEKLLLNVLFESNKELVLEKLREVEKEENKKK